MTAYFLFGDALTSPDMRHEVGEPVGDTFIFLEHDGRRIVAGTMLEEGLFVKREDVVDEFWNVHDLGIDALISDPSVDDDHVWPELARRALERAGVSAVAVPPDFPVLVADYLRGRGIDVSVDPAAWQKRRRAKTPVELEGIERAQRAAETAMLTAARMLKESEPTPHGTLRFEGEILTAEWIREAMEADLYSQGTEGQVILVHSGDACLQGHDPGTGPILPDRSCIIDCAPRDRRSGAHTDMTRTFVPGRPSDEIVRMHRTCLAALEIAFDAVRVGQDDAYTKVAEFFHGRGYPTYLHREGSELLTEGFFHALGHGVGLEVHEKPSIGMRPDRFVAGDVVALEPGVYFEGVGGVRLEDTVLVTDAGIEHLTDPYPYDLEP